MLSSDSVYLRPLILCGLIVIALAFHALNLSFASYELDEAVHIWYAQKSYVEVVEQAANDPNPPVYNLIISTWVKVFGVSEFSTRFFSVLMGVLGVVVMFLIASRNFGLMVGIIAALLYCFSPIQFRFTHLARPYSMLMVSVMLSYGFLLECLKEPSKRKLFWYYLFTTLMIYVHPTSVFNLAAQGLIIILNRYNSFKGIIRLMLPILAAAATFGIWVVCIPYFDRDDAMWFGPPDWEAIYYVIKVFFGSTEIILAQLAILILLGVLAVRKRQIGIDKSFAFVLIWAIVPFVISIVFSHTFKPVFQDKYILSVQPAFMLLLALSIHKLGKTVFRTIAIISVALLFVLVIDIEPNAEDDWRSAVEYVEPMHDENSIILIDPWYEFRTFAFYFDRHGYEVPDSTQWYINRNRVFTSWNDVYDTLNGKPRADVVHLMLAHQGYVKPEVPTDVIESVATLDAEKKFPGVTVRTYSFTDRLDVVAQVMRDFSETSEGVNRVRPEDEFSETIIVPLLDAVDMSNTVKIFVTVDVKALSDMDGVALVTSVEKPGQLIVYNRLELKDLKIAENQTRTISDHLVLSQPQTDYVLKVYVWNPNRKLFEIDNFQVVIKN